jgi:surface antigen
MCLHISSRETLRWFAARAALPSFSVVLRRTVNCSRHFCCGLGCAGAAIVGAAIGGALIGGFVGHKLDNRDKQMAAQAATQAFEQNKTGQPSVWNNPESGNSGSVTPTKTYQLANGQYCREYAQTITIGGEPQQTYGTACRQADGTWKIQS